MCNTEEPHMSDIATITRTVGLSAAAAKRIGEIAAVEGRPTCLRISVQDRGCLKDRCHEDDLRLLVNGRYQALSPIR